MVFEWKFIIFLILSLKFFKIKTKSSKKYIRIFISKLLDSLKFHSDYKTDKFLIKILILYNYFS